MYICVLINQLKLVLCNNLENTCTTLKQTPTNSPSILSTSTLMHTSKSEVTPSNEIINHKVNHKVKTKSKELISDLVFFPVPINISIYTVLRMNATINNYFIIEQLVKLDLPRTLY